MAINGVNERKRHSNIYQPILPGRPLHSFPSYHHHLCSHSSNSTLPIKVSYLYTLLTLIDTHLEMPPLPPYPVETHVEWEKIWGFLKAVWVILRWVTFSSFLHLLISGAAMLYTRSPLLQELFGDVYWVLSYPPSSSC